MTKSERTRASIMDAALEFLWSQPFREMSISKLMVSTRLSRSSFYQYFHDVHELMEALLAGLEQDVLAAISPWFTETGEPVELLRESLDGLVRVCYVQGPILRAVADAAPADERLERAWTGFLGRFDDGVTARIEGYQKQGLTPNFEARPVAISLNRLNAYTLIGAFGRRPRSKPEVVLDALFRIWVATLYGTIESPSRHT